MPDIKCTAYIPHMWHWSLTAASDWEELQAGKDNDKKVVDAQKKLDDKRADLKGYSSIIIKKHACIMHSFDVFGSTALFTAFRLFFLLVMWQLQHEAVIFVLWRWSGPCRQLDAMANATLDGDFEKEEMRKQKQNLQEGLDEIESLQKELKSAAKADSKE